MSSLCRGLALLTLAALGLASSLAAAQCVVPGTHETIQAAVDDDACSVINLGPQEFGESVLVDRDLTLQGAPGGLPWPRLPLSTIEGRVEITGEDIVAQIHELNVSDPGDEIQDCERSAVSVVEGATLEGLRLDVVGAGAAFCGIDLIFADGFESGDHSAWATTVP